MEIKLGALPRAPQPQDDIAGGASRVIYKVRLNDGQWDRFVPNDSEVQWNEKIGDFLTCTNQGCSNSFDSQVNWMIANNLIPPEKLALLEKHGFIKDGQFNTSERFNAILSGTNGGQIDPNIQLLGNYAYKPWDSARNDGMAPESLFPSNIVVSKQEYFDKNNIPPEVWEAAKVCHDIFAVQYEIIGTDIPSMQFHSKQAPITIVTGVCPGWGNGIIQACPLTSGHETLYYGWKLNEFHKDLDSYLPTKKTLAWDYKIGAAIKGVVLLRSELNTFTHNFRIPMGIEKINTEAFNDSTEVRALQVALHLEGVLNDSSWPTLELVQKFGGYFGQNTKEAVMRFQKKYLIQQTGFVGSKTLAKLNAIFNNPL